MTKINCATSKLALAAAGLLTACGGGGGTSTGPLLSTDAATEIQALTGSGPPEETREEIASKRDGVEFPDREPVWAAYSPTDERDFDALRDLAASYWNDRHTFDPVLTKSGITFSGSQGGGKRVYGSRMDFGTFAVFTHDAKGGEIHAWAVGVPSGSSPSGTTGTATWNGLMVGADKDSLALLQGDAEVQFNFGEMTVDVEFTDIKNLDDRAAHSVETVMFPNIPVSEDGRWIVGDDDTPRWMSGGFGGINHEEAGGAFYTEDMTGAFGAKQ